MYQQHGPSFSDRSGPGTELGAFQVVQVVEPKVRSQTGAPSHNDTRNDAFTPEKSQPYTGCSGPRRTPSAGFLVAGQQENGACALTDWLAEPAPEPIGVLLVVRRAAGWCGGRGARAVAGETPGEFPGNGFGGGLRCGGRSLLSLRRQRGRGPEALRAQGRGYCGRRRFLGSSCATVGETEAGEREQRGQASRLPGRPLHGFCRRPGVPRTGSGLVSGLQ